MKRRFSRLAVVALSGAFVFAPAVGAVAAPDPAAVVFAEGEDQGTGGIEYRDEDGNLVDPVFAQDIGPDRSGLAREVDGPNRAQFARTEGSKERDTWPWIVSTLLGLLAPLLLLTHRKHHNHQHDYEYGYREPGFRGGEDYIEYRA